MTVNLRDSLFAQRKTFLFLHASTWLVLVLLVAAFCWIDFYANECGCLKTISNFPLTDESGHPATIDRWLPVKLFYSLMIGLAGVFLLFAVIIAESVAQQKRMKIQFSLGMLFTLLFLIAMALLILRTFGTLN